MISLVQLIIEATTHLPNLLAKKYNQPPVIMQQLEETLRDNVTVKGLDSLYMKGMSNVYDLFSIESKFKTELVYINLDNKPDKDKAQEYINSFMDEIGNKLIENIRQNKNKLNVLMNMKSLTDIKKKLLPQKAISGATEDKISYPNGWCWKLLKTREEEKEEGRLMQHCGTDERGNLWSLRDENNNPHITITYNKNDNIIWQIKGKQNSSPKRDYWWALVDGEGGIGGFVNIYKCVVIDSGLDDILLKQIYKSKNIDYSLLLKQINNPLLGTGEKIEILGIITKFADTDFVFNACVNILLHKNKFMIYKTLKALVFLFANNKITMSQKEEVEKILISMMQDSNNDFNTARYAILDFAKLNIDINKYATEILNIFRNVKDNYLRFRLVEYISERKNKTEEIVNILISILKDKKEDWLIKEYAIFGISNSNLDNNYKIEILGRFAINDKKYRVRMAAIKNIARLDNYGEKTNGFAKQMLERERHKKTIQNIETILTICDSLRHNNKKTTIIKSECRNSTIWGGVL